MSLTRRHVVAGAIAGTAVAVGGGVLVDRLGSGTAQPTAGRGGLPWVARPGRQHGWDAHLARDAAGNRLPPRYQRLVFCALAAEPTPRRAYDTEAALRRVERTVGGDHTGLLLTLGWGPGWFRRLGLDPPVPPAVALNDFEVPRLDDPACVLHLGSDDPAVLDRVEGALFGGETLRGSGGSTDLRGLLRVTGRRAGFVGAGLPEAHRKDVVGLPQDQPLPKRTPMYMGFQSGLKRNQATEDDVTIASGRWAGGTTMHVSMIALALDSWYRSVDEAGRAQRMFTATTRPRDVRRHPRGQHLPADVDVAEVARKYGVVGHAEAAAAARRAGRPRILRRDFNSDDGGAARVHFVALARSIDDFVLTRQAMDARRAVGTNTVGQQINNGINEWMTVEARANLLVPTRRDRVCPGLPGWSA